MPVSAAHAGVASSTILLLCSMACSARDEPAAPSAATSDSDSTSLGSTTLDDPPPPDDGDAATGRIDLGSSPDDGNPATTGSSAPVTGTTGGDEPPGPLDVLSDEFDDEASLADWMLLSEALGDPPRHARLAIEAGHLILEPVAGGWFEEFQGPMLFKTITGDFAVETHVRAASLQHDTSPPELPFNSAGLIVADPANAPGHQNWITHNVGRQAGNIATEGKNTVESASVLELIPGVHHGRLRVCRVGDDFILARRLDDEDAFEVRHEFRREDLPATLRVGVMANGWNSLGETPDTSTDPDVVGIFDYVRFWTPGSESDCVQ